MSSRISQNPENVQRPARVLMQTTVTCPAGGGCGRRGGCGEGEHGPSRHLPNCVQGWAAFRVLICHLCVFSAEIFVQIFGPFFFFKSGFLIVEF